MRAFPRTQLSCPKCSQGIGNWFKDGSAVPRNAELARVAAGVEAAAREATAALSEALAAQEANEGAEEGGQEENGDPEASEDGDAVAGEEEDVWNEEEDLPEDAILVGEMCKVSEPLGWDGMGRAANDSDSEQGLLQKRGPCREGGPNRVTEDGGKGEVPVGFLR